MRKEMRSMFFNPAEKRFAVKELKSESEIEKPELKLSALAQSIDNLANKYKCKSHGFTNVESKDGSKRYKLGIIDFLTKYGKLKMVESGFKSSILGRDKNDISAIDP